jgi:hypothetical protein
MAGFHDRHHVSTRSLDRDMNDITTFLVATAAIFGAITVLLVLMSHLESRRPEHDTEDGPRRAAQKPLLTTQSAGSTRRLGPRVHGQTSD